MKKGTDFFFYSLLMFCLLTGCSIFRNEDSTAKGNAGAQKDTVSLAFYNVENLFDTLDNPEKDDDDFLPGSKQQWTSQRYEKKINDIGKVIAAMSYPVIMGLCEVENAEVLTDLVSLPGMNYDFVHHESPDNRGIDNALLYNPKYFKVKSSNTINLIFPDSIVEDYTSRDILEVQGELAGEEIFVFVNHWPSRRGGVRESEPKRTFVASRLRTRINEIQSVQPEAAIVIMGDFNDEPVDKSIREVLHAISTDSTYFSTQLYNLFYDDKMAGKGSYNYRGNWNMLDQVIITGNLLAHSNITVTESIPFQQEWMMYQDSQYGPVPNRTYGGPNYYGGYSDHLPVRVELIIKK